MVSFPCTLLRLPRAALHNTTVPLSGPAFAPTAFCLSYSPPMLMLFSPRHPSQPRTRTYHPRSADARRQSRRRGQRRARLSLVLVGAASPPCQHRNAPPPWGPTHPVLRVPRRSTARMLPSLAVATHSPMLPLRPPQPPSLARQRRTRSCARLCSEAAQRHAGRPTALPHVLRPRRHCPAATEGTASAACHGRWATACC